jgi:hypothetical protein
MTFAVGRIADRFGGPADAIVNSSRLRGSSAGVLHHHAGVRHDVMSDNVLAGLFVGLLIGGTIGAMVMAVLATGSKQRFSRIVAKRAEVTDASGQASADSSPEGDDIDQEMRDLVRRYRRRPGS